jgi:hypothetical protein
MNCPYCRRLLEAAVPGNTMSIWHFSSKLKCAWNASKLHHKFPHNDPDIPNREELSEKEIMNNLNRVVDRQQYNILENYIYHTIA